MSTSPDVYAVVRVLFKSKLERVAANSTATNFRVRRPSPALFATTRKLLYKDDLAMRHRINKSELHTCQVSGTDSYIDEGGVRLMSDKAWPNSNHHAFSMLYGPNMQVNTTSRGRPASI